MQEVPQPRNLMEELVTKAYQEIITEYPEVCSCPQCRVDAIALALNKLSAKYVSTSLGEMHAKVELGARQNQIDVWMTVRQAIQQVSGRPHHERVQRG